MSLPTAARLLRPAASRPLQATFRPDRGGVIALAMLAALFAVLALYGRAWAADPARMTSGSLLLRAKGGDYVEAVRLGTDVDMTVSGMTVRTRVTQAFRNVSDHWVEAVYVYPLPEDGGVDTLKMTVGDRVIVGEVKKKADAKALYERAKAEGRVAGLVEQDRPNLFTNSVANIGPGETVVVQIEYQAPVALSDGEYSLRVPLVAAPRYTPAGGAPSAESGAPLLDPRRHRPVNPVSITVRLRPGFALTGLSSRNHAVSTRNDPAGGKIVSLVGGEVPADRDFELIWRAAPSSAPTVGLFREHVAGGDYVLAQVTPPIAPRKGPPVPREIVFVIDNSGSMGGTSIRQAKAGLAYGLSRLKPGDRFNVVRFDHTLTVLFPDSVPADAAHLGQAQKFVAGLDAAGGTEMVPAMRAALADPRPYDASHVRQVVFLTDGEISNEQQLFDAITAGRGRSRVFMAGIGSAPNTFLMTRAAELGRGTYTHIGSVDAVENQMRQLFEKLESPAATNLTATVEGTSADLAPAVLPDLYRGEPVMIAAKVGATRGVLRVAGMVDGKPWEARLPLQDAAPGEGISKLWARRRIADAEVARSLGRITAEEADARVLALGLDHHLVTSQTSLVAVDETPSRPVGTPLVRSDLPLNLPAGWDFDALFGGVRHGAQRPPAGAEAGQGVEGVDLPQTATDAPLLMLLGLGGLAAGAAVAGGTWVAQRRRAA